MTESWQEQGIATVLVVREMPSGNLTMASFLVDTFCLGVKDTAYYHNLTTYDFEELVDKFSSIQDMVSCDYVEAHNVIYGAIAFAEELGFEPHKDFSLTQYYLEEDDEQVDLIEYEFGKEGKPLLFVEAGQNVARYTSKLDHSVGKGNYDVIVRGEWEDETPEPFDLDPERPFHKILMNYQPKVEPEGGWENTESQEIEIMYDKMESEYDKVYQDRSEELYDAIEETYYMATDPEEAAEAVELLRDYLKEFPEYPPFYNFLHNALKNSGQHDEAWKVANQLYDKFPDYLHAKLGMASELVEQKKPDEAFKILDEKYNVMNLYPEQRIFHFTEILAHSLFMVKYFMEKENVDRAILYYKLMYSISEDHAMTISAESMLGPRIVLANISKLVEESIDDDLP
jgi:tetratricopeptide (TPR) repeat protein